jgi:uncharacterized protein (TIGR01777 family)
MKKIVLITGANGMLAKALASHLSNDYDIRFLSRGKSKPNEFFWDPSQNFIDPEALVGVHHIIHLAGATIGNKRWNNKRKNLILSSRVDGANLIRKELSKNHQVIESFISISGVGYYGTVTSNAKFDELSPKGNDFLADVCVEWEQACQAFETEHIAKRTAIIRSGVILERNEGVYKSLSQLIKFGFGSAVGSGKQYMPWIHIQDLVRMFKFVLDDTSQHGIFNGVAPQQITNLHMMQAIAKGLHKSIYLPNVPKFILQLIFGEMSIVILEGSQVSAEKIVKAGFKFKFDSIENAVNHLNSK